MKNSGLESMLTADKYGGMKKKKKDEHGFTGIDP